MVKGQSHRVKGNVKPSSSLKAANILVNNPKFAKTGFIGFETTSEDVKSLYTSNTIYDACLRKLGKKDALEEIKEISNIAMIQDINDFIPQWKNYVHSDLSIRELTLGICNLFKEKILDQTDNKDEHINLYLTQLYIASFAPIKQFGALCCEQKLILTQLLCKTIANNIVKTSQNKKDNFEDFTFLMANLQCINGALFQNWNFKTNSYIIELLIPNLTNYVDSLQNVKQPTFPPTIIHCVLQMIQTYIQKSPWETLKNQSDFSENSCPKNNVNDDSECEIVTKWHECFTNFVFQKLLTVDDSFSGVAFIKNGPMLTEIWNSVLSIVSSFKDLYSLNNDKTISTNGSDIFDNFSKVCSLFCDHLNHLKQNGIKPPGLHQINTNVEEKNYPNIDITYVVGVVPNLPYQIFYHISRTLFQFDIKSKENDETDKAFIHVTEFQQTFLSYIQSQCVDKMVESIDGKKQQNRLPYIPTFRSVNAMDTKDKNMATQSMPSEKIWKLYFDCVLTALLEQSITPDKIDDTEVAKNDLAKNFNRWYFDLFNHVDANDMSFPQIFTDNIIALFVHLNKNGDAANLNETFIQGFQICLQNTLSTDELFKMAANDEFHQYLLKMKLLTTVTIRLIDNIKNIPSQARSSILEITSNFIHSYAERIWDLVQTQSPIFAGKENSENEIRMTDNNLVSIFTQFLILLQFINREKTLKIENLTPSPNELLSFFKLSPHEITEQLLPFCLKLDKKYDSSEKITLLISKIFVSYMIGHVQFQGKDTEPQLQNEITDACKLMFETRPYLLYYLFVDTCSEMGNIDFLPKILFPPIFDISMHSWKEQVLENGKNSSILIENYGKCLDLGQNNDKILKDHAKIAPMIIENASIYVHKNIFQNQATLDMVSYICDFQQILLSLTNASTAEESIPKKALYFYLLNFWINLNGSNLRLMQKCCIDHSIEDIDLSLLVQMYKDLYHYLNGQLPTLMIHYNDEKLLNQIIDDNNNYNQYWNKYIDSLLEYYLFSLQTGIPNEKNKNHSLLIDAVFNALSEITRFIGNNIFTREVSLKSVIWISDLSSAILQKVINGLKNLTSISNVTYVPKLVELLNSLCPNWNIISSALDWVINNQEINHILLVATLYNIVHFQMFHLNAPTSIELKLRSEEIFFNTLSLTLVRASYLLGYIATISFEYIPILAHLPTVIHDNFNFKIFDSKEAPHGTNFDFSICATKLWSLIKILYPFNSTIKNWIDDNQSIMNNKTFLSFNQFHNNLQVISHSEQRNIQSIILSSSEFSCHLEGIHTLRFIKNISQFLSTNNDNTALKLASMKSVALYYNYMFKSLLQYHPKLNNHDENLNSTDVLPVLQNILNSPNSDMDDMSTFLEIMPASNIKNEINHIFMDLEREFVSDPKISTIILIIIEKLVPLLNQINDVPDAKIDINDFIISKFANLYTNYNTALVNKYKGIDNKATQLNSDGLSPPYYLYNATVLEWLTDLIDSVILGSKLFNKDSLDFLLCLAVSLMPELHCGGKIESSGDEVRNIANIKFLQYIASILTYLRKVKTQPNNEEAYDELADFFVEPLLLPIFKQVMTFIVRSDNEISFKTMGEKSNDFLDNINSLATLNHSCHILWLAFDGWPDVFVRILYTYFANQYTAFQTNSQPLLNNNKGHKNTESETLEAKELQEDLSELSLIARSEKTPKSNNTPNSDDTIDSYENLTEEQIACLGDPLLFIMYKIIDTYQTFFQQALMGNLTKKLLPSIIAENSASLLTTIDVSHGNDNCELNQMKILSAWIFFNLNNMLCNYKNWVKDKAHLLPDYDVKKMPKISPVLQEEMIFEKISDTLLHTYANALLFSKIASHPNSSLEGLIKNYISILILQSPQYCPDTMQSIYRLKLSQITLEAYKDINFEDTILMTKSGNKTNNASEFVKNFVELYNDLFADVYGDGANNNLIDYLMDDLLYDMKCYIVPYLATTPNTLIQNSINSNNNENVMHRILYQIIPLWWKNVGLPFVNSKLSKTRDNSITKEDFYTLFTLFQTQTMGENFVTIPSVFSHNAANLPTHLAYNGFIDYKILKINIGNKEICHHTTTCALFSSVCLRFVNAFFAFLSFPNLVRIAASRQFLPFFAAAAANSYQIDQKGTLVKHVNHDGSITFLTKTECDKLFAYLLQTPKTPPDKMANTQFMDWRSTRNNIFFTNLGMSSTIIQQQYLKIARFYGYDEDEDINDAQSENSESPSKTSGGQKHLEKLQFSDLLSSKVSQTLKAQTKPADRPYAQKDNTFRVKLKPKIQEISAIYEAEDFRLELEIKFSPNNLYPYVPCSLQIIDFANPTLTESLCVNALARDSTIAPRKVKAVSGSSKGGKIPISTLRHWLLQMNIMINTHGDILQGLQYWHRSVERYLSGACTCMICFSIINPKDYKANVTATAPSGTLLSHNKMYNVVKYGCSQCKNRYHPACLYKWFKTSQNTTCPLCRSKL